MSEIRFESVGKSFGDVSVVRDFDLTIRDGEFLAFLGPSGCGKTTTLRMVAGLEFNTSGKIYIDQILVSDAARKFYLAPEKRRVGMVFQSYAVWPHMTVFDNIAYPLKIAKVDKAELMKRVQDAIGTVELTGFEKRYPQSLSGGQQQRVALARGLVMQPKVLLLDEPLSNLDAKLREKMRKDIREIQQNLRLTTILVTHDQVEATTMADRMAVMNEGRIVQVGSPDELKRKPADAFVADFLR